jgi:hypothetical protein
MEQQTRGVKVMVAKNLAARKNAVALSAFVTTAGERSRARTFKDPEFALKQFEIRASSKLEILSKHSVTAKDVLKKAQGREDSQELDLNSYHAETVAAKVVVSLHKALSTLFETSKNAGDRFALERVALAADCLSAHVNDELLAEVKYPNDPTIKSMLVERNVRTAKQAYLDVLDCLCGVQEEMGVRMPNFPSGPSA